LADGDNQRDPYVPAASRSGVAIIGAGLVTVFYPSAWPDLIVGLGIAVLNADVARQVWQAAREEHRSAQVMEVRRRQRYVRRDVYREHTRVSLAHPIQHL